MYVGAREKERGNMVRTLCSYIKVYFTFRFFFSLFKCWSDKYLLANFARCFFQPHHFLRTVCIEDDAEIGARILRILHKGLHVKCIQLHGASAVCRTISNWAKFNFGGGRLKFPRFSKKNFESLQSKFNRN